MLFSRQNSYEPALSKWQRAEFFLNKFEKLLCLMGLGCLSFGESEYSFLGRVLNRARGVSGGDEGFDGVDFARFELCEGNLMYVRNT